MYRTESRSTSSMKAHEYTQARSRKRVFTSQSPSTFGAAFYVVGARNVTQCLTRQVHSAGIT